MKTFEFMCAFAISCCLILMGTVGIITTGTLDEPLFQTLVLVGIGWCVLTLARRQLKEP